MRTVVLGLLLALPGVPQRVEELPSPVKDRRWVVDGGSMLRGEYEGRIRRFLDRVHARTKAQVAVATVERVAPAVGPREFARRLFAQWQLGRAGANDGVLIFLSRDDRAVEIITGSGLTARLPNERMDALVREKLIPALRRGEAGAGVLEAAKQIGAELAGIERGVPPLTPAARSVAWVLLVAGLASGSWAVTEIFRRRNGPLLLPATGSGAASSPAAVTGEEERFFELQAFGLYGLSCFRYGPWQVWTAIAGQALFAAAASALLMTATLRDLEPGIWTVAAIAGLGSFLQFSTIGIVHSGKGILRAGLVAAAISGGFAGLIAIRTLLPDRLLAVYFAPAWVGLFNLAAGWVFSRNLERKPRGFACRDCRSPLVTVSSEQAGGLLDEWERKASERRILAFRAWRCPRCHPELDRTGAYLVHAVLGDGRVCAKCKRPAIHHFQRKVFLVSECLACGHETSRRQKAARAEAGGAQYAASSESGPSSTQERNDTGSDYRWDGVDSGPASGGSTDGDGAGGRW